MIAARGVVCLVTDRRCTSGPAEDDASARLLRLIASAIDAGIDLIQVRERDIEAAPLAAIVDEAVRRSRGTATRVVVNDRLDVALACGADGVHLRGDSIPAAVARTIAPPGFLIGRSVHSVEEAIGAAAAADYLIAGTCFETRSKPGATVLLGAGGLAAIARAVPVPVLAIGGVTLDRAGEIAAAGAAGVAAIGLFDDPATLRETVQELRRAFDTATRGS